MRRLAVLALVVACTGARRPPRQTIHLFPTVHAAPPKLELPEFRLPRTFVPSAYRARLAIEERSIAGEIVIEGDIHDATDLIWLRAVDLTIAHAAATRADQTVSLQARSDRGFLALHSAVLLAPGHWTLHITYVGAIREQTKLDCAPDWFMTRSCKDDVSYGLFSEHLEHDPYWFTNFEPNGARRVFPCFDEPEVKVPWQLTLIVPKGLVAASNTPVAQHTTLDDKRERFEFEATRPLPSYLVAFAVGPFDIVDARPTSAGVPIRLLVPRGQASAAATLAATTPELVEHIATWLDVPFPYPKLDLVAVPFVGQRWLAMENAGLITFGTSVLSESKHWSTEIIGHEIAHQWFGDLVTPAWWDDVWLNEGFATWMASKIMVQLEGNSFAWRYQWPTRPIRVPLTSTNIDTMIFPYMDGHVGAELIAMIEEFISEPVLQRALHEYLTTHAHGLVTSADLIRAINAVSSEKLDDVFATYLDEPRQPDVTVGLACTADRRMLELSTRPPDTTVPLCLSYDRDGKRERVCRLVGGKPVDIELDAKHCPEWVLPTAGMYRVSWTDRELRGLLAKWKSLDQTDRRQLLYALQGRPADSQLAMAPLLVDTGDRDAIDAALDLLVRDASLVPDDLVSKWNQWVKKHFAAEAHAAKLDVDNDDPTNEHARRVVRLVATTGDSELAAAARARLESAKKKGSPLGETVVRLAIDSTPDLAMQLLEQAPALEKGARGQVLAALARTRGILDLIKADPKRIEALDGYEQMRLLAGTCDRAGRDEAEEIVKLLGGNLRVRGALAWIDRCIERRAKLEPIFRAWLAH